MSRQTPSVSTDQVRAFVELAHFGSLRLAAQALHLSEEGMRSRLLMLEERLGVSLYQKERGRRSSVSLTHAGQVFHSKAVQFLEEAKNLTELFELGQTSHEIRIGVSYYIANFYLSDILKDFHGQFPTTTVQISTGTEQQIISVMQSDTKVRAGICVCDEFPKNLRYRPLLSLHWCFVAPPDNPLLKQSSVTLEELAHEPLIMFEPPCSGRQRVLEAFYAKNLTPRINVEVTTTQMILSLVEQGMGTAIIPVMQPSAVLNGRRIGEVSISDPIRPVEFGILSREDIGEDDACSEFLNFILTRFSQKHSLERTENYRPSLNVVGQAHSRHGMNPQLVRVR